MCILLMVVPMDLFSLPLPATSLHLLFSTLCFLSYHHFHAEVFLTFTTPSSFFIFFPHQFRDFRLWHKDVLTVSWTKEKKVLFESYNETFMRAEPSPEETRKLDDAETVNFAFNAGVSYGAKGFVICFTCKYLCMRNCH